MAIARFVEVSQREDVDSGRLFTFRNPVNFKITLSAKSGLKASLNIYGGFQLTVTDSKNQQLQVERMFDDPNIVPEKKENK